MKRHNLVLMAVAALLGSTLTGTALAQQASAFQGGGSAVFQAQYNQGGGWGDNRGDHRWGDRDRDRFRATTLEGRWIIDNRGTSFDRNAFQFGRGGMRNLQLPDLINIDQNPNMVRITDRRNRSLEVIMLGGKFDRGHHGDNHPDYVFGRMYGSTLVVRHEGSRGATITQKFDLQNRGRTLVVTTTRERFNGRTVEFTNTYHRA